MAHYKVSYKVLSEQGTALKNIAKQIDSYTARINGVRGKLGDDQLLLEIRNNLQKLAQQMDENRTVLNMASDVVLKCVEQYAGTEKTNVKKVDSVKAHNRDFYKNPVVVASAGGNNMTVNTGAAAGVGAMASGGTGAAAAGAGTMASPMADSEGSSSVEINMSYSETNTTTVTAGAERMEDTFSTAPAAATERPIYDGDVTLQGGGVSAGTATGIGLAAATAGAGALYGGEKLAQYIKDRKKQEEDSDLPEAKKYKDAEARLAEARERLANINATEEQS